MSEEELVVKPEKQLVTQPEKRLIIEPEIQFMIPPEKPRVKHKLKALNLETRMKVIEDAAAGLSQRKLAEKYECSKTQIHKILQKKEIIKEKWRKNANRNTKKETFQPYREINDLTLAWVEWARTQNISINGRYLREIASSYAKHLKIEKFSASTGWLEKFCRRNNIVFKNVNNENKSIESKTENENNLSKSQCRKNKSVE
ncbi:Major centromere autoantigen B, partial [Stegodyphus mimosarum]